MRKLTFILAACIFLVACYSLYSSLEASTTKKRAVYERGRKEIDELESRVKQLQDELNKNEQIINDIRQKINFVVGGSAYTQQQPINSVDELKSFVSRNPFTPENLLPVPIVDSSSNASHCLFSKRSSASSDVQMLDIYEMLQFDNPDGGVWKQGWNIKYDKNLVEKTPKLLVYVIPHSHTDPGWIKTFEKYYQDQTKNILDNMLKKLPNYSQMKFMYAEMSFFERWWRDIDDSKRAAVKILAESGQFEIVTGAWVMTDEANAHYFSMIDQLIEGNQWLENHLNYKPKNHWSIDPFGLSSTMTYLLKLANFSSMTIQRVHYSIKKEFAKEKKLEFMWRQLWSYGDESDIFCHMFPFYSYDVPHTCGPDPKVCCQFDFRRLPGSGINCPWHVPPVPITDVNVDERAAMLLDQYRKKAELYKTNVLLIPLGDDFRYDTDQEWDGQYENYQRLFKHMNGRKDWNVQAQFGTLNDYFEALFKRTETPIGQKPKDFPVLSGDFFTYADRDDHYWSGYYTSRPFYKRMDRVLQHYLRGAEIVYSLSLSYAKRLNLQNYPSDELFSLLVNSRRNLGLFQHHDGITGTAKDAVVIDYGTRLLQSVQDCRKIIASSIELMLTSDKKLLKQEIASLPLEFHERIVNHDSVPEKIIFAVGREPKSVFVYNSLGFERQEIVCIHAASTNVEIRDESKDSSIIIKEFQINPVIFKDRDRMEVSSAVFEICWVATVAPLGVARFTVKEGDNPSTNEHGKALIRTNFASSTNSNFKTQQFDSEIFSVKTPFYVATFDQKSGFLTKLRFGNNGEDHVVKINFVTYGTVNEKDKSGAYLFLPDGPAKDLSELDNRVLLVEGTLFSVVHVVFAQVKHTVKLCHIQSVNCQGIDVSNLVDITQEHNYELVMRVKTDIKNTDRTFFTDLNGLQMVKRRYFEKIPLQGNVYPIPTAAYIEDERSRFTLLTAQPLGAGSMEKGWLEVFLDRRLMQDDNRGLFQPVTDNKVTPNHFRLVFENRLPGSTLSSRSQKIGYHTSTAHLNSLTLSHPLFVLYNKDAEPKSKFLGESTPLTKSLPCDVHLINLRTLENVQKYDGASSTTSSYPNVTPKNQQVLLLHRVGVDCSSSMTPVVACNVSDGTIAMNDLFSDFNVDSLEETSLTMMYSKYHFQSTLPYATTIQPMDIKTFKMRLK